MNHLQHSQKLTDDNMALLENDEQTPTTIMKDQYINNWSYMFATKLAVYEILKALIE